MSCLKPQSGFAQASSGEPVYRDSLVSSFTRIDHRPLRAGAYGGVGFDYLTASELTSPLTSPCDFFSNGVGRSTIVGLQADIPYWGDLSSWTVIPRLSYQHFGGTLHWTEVDSGRITSGLGSGIRAVPFDHALDISVSGLSLGVLFSYHPFSFLDLSAGPEASFLVASHFDRSTSAITPGDLIDGARSISYASGKLPNRRTLLAGIYGSIAAEVPLSSKLRVIPELGYDLPFFGVSPEISARSIRASVGFELDLTPRYEYVPSYIKVRVPVPRDTAPVVTEPTKPQSHLSATIEAVAIDKDNNESKVLTISVQEVRSRSAYPLLNYIFFDKGSAELPKRYVTYANLDEAMRATGTQSELKGIKLLDLYHRTLNIIGSRLRQQPRTSITLVGYTSNTGVEEGNLTLSMARAETVKKYLVNVWQIAPSRIKTQARLLPEHPSPVGVAAGDEENRRVEILVSNEALLDPVTVVNTERIATPPNLRIIPHIVADTGLLSIRTSLSGGGRELLSSETGPNSSRSSKVWQLDEEVLEQLSDSLVLRLQVEDSAGNRVTAKQSIPLVVKHLSSEPQSALSRFSLILFGFDESRVGVRNQRVLNMMARALPELNPERLSIVGYTDEMGDPQHNDALSLERAKAISRELEPILAKLQLPGLESIVTDGRGSHEPLYDNHLPEGRFFSRTVNITIESKLR